MPLLQVPPTVKDAGAPATTAALAGCGEIVRTGAVAVTVSVALLLVALPAALLATARKVAPLSPSTVVPIAYAVPVAPAMSAPLRCHW